MGAVALAGGGGGKSGPRLKLGQPAPVQGAAVPRALLGYAVFGGGPGGGGGIVLLLVP